MKLVIMELFSSLLRKECHHTMLSSVGMKVKAGKNSKSLTRNFTLKISLSNQTAFLNNLWSMEPTQRWLIMLMMIML